MFLDYFGLSEQPFGVTPDPKFLYGTSMHKEVLASLICSIENRVGFAAVIAYPGMGKTTLLFDLLERYNRQARTAFVYFTQCTAIELMRHVLDDLGVHSYEDDLVRMLSNFKEFLVRESKPVVIVIDEAQNLDATALEALRLLSDFELPDRKLLHIILAGQPPLAEKLQHPSSEQLLQRITILCRLERLSPNMTQEYIAHRLSVAGYSGPPVFTPAAIESISRWAGGIPRLINQICFNSMMLACATRTRTIDSNIIEEVTHDLALNWGFDVEPLRVSDFKITNNVPQAISAIAAEAAAAEPIRPSEPPAPASPTPVIQSDSPLHVVQLTQPDPVVQVPPLSPVAAVAPAANTAADVQAAATSRARVDSTAHGTLVDLPSPDATEYEWERYLASMRPSQPDPPPEIRVPPPPPKMQERQMQERRFSAPPPPPQHETPQTEWERFLASKRTSRPALAHHPPTTSAVGGGRSGLGVATAVLGILAIGAGITAAYLHTNAAPYDVSAAFSKVAGNLRSVASTSSDSTKETEISTAAPVTKRVSNKPTRSRAPQPERKSAPPTPMTITPQAEGPTIISVGDRTTSNTTSASRAPEQAPAMSLIRLATANSGSSSSSNLTPEEASPQPTSETETSGTAPQPEVPRLQNATPIKMTKPIYPPLARSSRIEGEVVLSAKIDEEGLVKDVRLVLGNPLLGRAAEDALRQWRYRPSLRNDRPVPTETTVTMRFSLDDGK